MVWRRLYITVEGQTERKFADEILRPHLNQYSLDVRTRIVMTNRKLGKRGGILDFAKIRDDLNRLLREDRDAEAFFTTMIDLYALPSEFPGWDEARKKFVPRDRVLILEEAFRTEMGDDRFYPYTNCTSSRRYFIVICPSWRSVSRILRRLLPNF